MEFLIFDLAFQKGEEFLTFVIKLWLSKIMWQLLHSVLIVLFYLKQI